jgi:YD repeat-containing protein
MRYVLLIVFCNLWLINLAFAQSLPHIVDKVPTSPNAQGFSNAVLSSSSGFTGKPNIDIPIFQLTHKNIRVPISFSYNAEGVKVNDLASWVGMNWNLNAGGVITRIVKKLPDDQVTSGYFAMGYETQSTNIGVINSFYRGIRDGSIDAEPDLYTISFPGGTGTFYLNEDEEIYLSSLEKMKIEGKPYGGGGFTITTADGLIYEFKKVETSTVAGSGAVSTFTYESAWHLTKVSSPKFPTETVDFTYVQESLTNSFKVILEDRMWTLVAGDTESPFLREHFVSYGTWRLEEISSPLVKIEFIENSTGRLDISSSKALSKIVIKKRADTNSSFINHKVFQLSPTYTTAADNTKRLYLESITEKSGDETDSLPPYSFTYNSGAIPGYTSRAQDHWGFYNGKTGNTSFLKSEIYFSDSFYDMPGAYNLGTIFRNIVGADREPSETHLKMGVLNKITYPTGGTIEFDYEINKHATDEEELYGFVAEDYYSYGGIHVHFRNDWNYLKTTFGEYEVEDEVRMSEAFGGDPLAPFISDTTNFNVNVTQFAQIKSETINSGGAPSGEEPFAKVQRLVSGTWQDVSGLYFSGTQQDSKWHELSSGDYRLITFAKYYQGPVSDYAKLRVFWLHKTTTPIEYEIGPGLRLLSIKEWDGTKTGKIQLRSFDYTDDEGKESGVLYKPALNSYKYYDGSSLNNVYLVQKSQNQYNYLGGPALGYGKVTEFYGENGEMGKKETYYEAYPPVELFLESSNPDSRNYPFPEPNFSTYSFGKVLETMNYKKVDGSYQVISKTENQYEYTLEYTDKKAPGILAGIFEEVTSNYDFKFIIQYDRKTLWSKLKKSVTTEYEDSSTRVSEKTFTYESTPGHLNPLTVEEKLTSGNEAESVITYMSYPLDYAHKASPFTSALVDAHMHNSLIEIFKARKVGSQWRYFEGQVYEYSSSAAHLQPIAIYNWYPQFGNKTYQTTFTASKGSLGSGIALDSRYRKVNEFTYQSGTNRLSEAREVALQGGSYQTINRTHFIYGHSNNLLLAQIQGADNVSETGFTSFENENLGNFTYATAGVQTSIASYAGNRYFGLTSSRSIQKYSLNSSKDYILSFWAKGTNSISITGGGSISPTGVWKYYQIPISNRTNITISSSGADIDEVRIHPKTSLMQTFNYDVLNGLLSENPLNGMPTRYEYDLFGRLKLIRDHKGDVRKVLEYYYQQSIN